MLRRTILASALRKPRSTLTSVAGYAEGKIAGRVPVPKTVEPGKEYLVVECRNCQRKIAFDEAPPVDEPAYLANELPICCPHCGHKAVYRPQEVRRSQGKYKH